MNNSSFSPYFTAYDPISGLPTIKMSLPTLINVIKIIPHKYGQSPISWVNLDPIKLIVK